MATNREHFDHIILGTGQATSVLLDRLIATGDRIAVVEARKVGGSCVNYGCTPTKTLVASARAFHMARRGDFFGFRAESLELDYARVRERMNNLRNQSSDGLEKWMEETSNIELIRGRGYFVSKHILQVGGRKLYGDKIYINVGTRPRKPNLEGIDLVSWMDSARLLEQESLPEHLLILGGGYVGTEFAQVYRRFGSRVTLFHRGDQLMNREDADVASAIREILEDEGVRVVLNAKAKQVSQEGPHIRLDVAIDGELHEFKGSDLLVAAGRIPNSDTLAPEAGGVQVDDRGYIQVDAHCETAVPGVFALGDVNGQGAFTHTSVNDAEIVLDRLFGGTRRLQERNLIYALFTDPPLGRVGMTEKDALDSGRKVLKATRAMSRISRAKEMGETRGFAKLLVDADTDQILGASILGAGGDEIVNMFASIMHSGIPCREYRKVVLVHPTVSELMPWILDDIRKAREGDGGSPQ